MKPPLFCLVIMSILPVAPAEISVGGIMRHDMRWNNENSPVIVTSDIVVPAGVTLTISPGVKIIVKKPAIPDTLIPQHDSLDIRLVSIIINGTLSCVGKRDKRITFIPEVSGQNLASWYGIILDRADETFTEISFTDISNAYCGIMVKNCAPVIRTTLIEFNHIGLLCTDHGAARIINCVISHNRACGIRVINANPHFANSIIYANQNNGIWCDGISKISFSYNCIADNRDGNFFECDPEIGHRVKKNSNGDSIDTYNNIMGNPIFAGSAEEAIAKKKDPAIPTDQGSIKNKILAAIIQKPVEASPSAFIPQTGKYRLSSYSPCLNSGNPAKKFDDIDETANDMGIYGGPDFIESKVHE